MTTARQPKAPPQPFAHQVDVGYIASLCKLAEVHGIDRMKVGEVEIHFHARAPASLTMPPEKLGEEHGNPTEDELLFASSPLGPPEKGAMPPA